MDNLLSELIKQELKPIGLSSIQHKYYTNILKTILKNNNIFGFFLTLKRGKYVCKQIFSTTNEEDYHHLCVQACLGYWNYGFNKIDNEEFLLNKILLIQKDLINDSRYANFKDFPLIHDFKASLELTFLLLPIYPIRLNGLISNLNTSFNNKKYDLLFKSKNHVATYLPGVFPNIRFDKIRESLESKAGYDSYNKENKYFYAYQTLHKYKYIGKQYELIIIPHAGIDYAGIARKNVFKTILNRKCIKQIYFIATVHNLFQKNIQSDHSYEWVKNELYTYFPNAQHKVFFPKKWLDSKKIET